MRRVSGDSGLAALELGLVITTLVAMLALVAPLAYLMYEDGDQGVIPANELKPDLIA